jgi:cytoskeletal protein CcmA (bactofilin family)
MARDIMEKDVIKAFLGDETEFTGFLTFEGTVRIDGKFNGEIKTTDNLIIGQTAVIKATISCGSIMVIGKVEGDILATKKLHISSKGVVIGNVFTPALHIEDGAVLEGNVSMTKQESDANVLPLIRKKKIEGEEPRQNIPVARA